MRRQFRPAAVLLLLMTALTGLAYPLLVTGIAQVALPWQADGSLILQDGKAIGSDPIGQRFAGPGYFHPRPSAAGREGYEGLASGGSNLGPSVRALTDRVAAAVAARQTEGPGPVPADLVTMSASGLDPHVSPAAALFQVPRIAKSRGIEETRLTGLVERFVEERTFGFLGEPRVNVLRLNRALDELAGGARLKP